MTAPVAALAQLVAEMHMAFASGGVREATPGEATAWLDGALADLAAADLDPAAVAAIRPRLLRIGDAAGTPVIPIHGDLHVGQVLRVAGPRYYVVDFDGNPVTTPEERNAPLPAARDVAGMLSSIDHVGRVVIHRTADLESAGRAKVLEWIDAAQQRFVAIYDAALSQRGAEHLLDRALIRPFMIQQECREYAYASRYLPHWRYVPDAALPALLAKEDL